MSHDAREAIAQIVRVAMQEEFLHGSKWESQAGRVATRYAYAETAAGQILAALSPDPVLLGEVRYVLERLRKSAAMLQQNSESCAANHHGGDIELFGMPGWLVDTRADIDAALDLLAKLPKLTGEEA